MLLVSLGESEANPRIFPTEEGGIRLEWVVRGQDVSAEVDDRGGIYVHSLDLDTMEDVEAALGFDDASARLRNWLF
jgi:hypothetical protein